MKLTIFKDAETLAENLADFILNLIKTKPDATLVLTSGDTPKLAYQKLAIKAKKGDFNKVTIIGLDEWVGISADNIGSCSSIVINNLLKPLGISARNYTFFDALNPDLESECQRIDTLIFDKGGIDFMLVGLGLNGHIGLNEPGTPFSTYCHISDLAQLTIEVGQKYFNEKTELKKGVTIGLKHLEEAKCAMVIATGQKKSSVVNEMLNGKITEDFPATIFQTLANGLVWVDEDCKPL